MDAVSCGNSAANTKEKSGVKPAQGTLLLNAKYFGFEPTLSDAAGWAIAFVRDSNQKTIG